MNIFRKSADDKDPVQRQNTVNNKQLVADHSRYEKLKQLGFACTSFEVLYSSRDFGVISDDMMDYLQKLTDEEDVLIGIHRTGKASLEDIESILTYGLIIGSLNENTATSPIKLSNNVSYYPNNKTIIKEIINADEHKGSLGAILIRIPDEDLSGNLFFVDVESGNYILDPKYVIGFIPVGPLGQVSEIITANPDVSDSIFKPLDALYEDREYAGNSFSPFGSKK